MNGKHVNSGGNACCILASSVQALLRTCFYFAWVHTSGW